MPFVIQTQRAVHMEEMGFPSKDVELETKYENIEHSVAFFISIS